MVRFIWLGGELGESVTALIYWPLIVPSQREWVQILEVKGLLITRPCVPFTQLRNPGNP